MKFALLGSDAESLALSTAAVVQGHELVWVGDVQESAIVGGLKSGQYPSWLTDWAEQDMDSLIDGLLWTGPGKVSRNDWQILLDRQTTDMVIVGRGQTRPEDRAEQLCSLARRGITVLSTHPVVPSVLSFYEIDMARGESGALFRHYHPTSDHPIVEKLAAWVRQGHPQLGIVEQIVCQRKLAERTSQQVLWHFARDVLLLARVAGYLNRLGALGSPSGDATYATLSVQMLGKLERAVHWSVGPEDGTAGLELTLLGQHGRLLLVIDEAGMPAKMVRNLDGVREELPIEPVHFDPTIEAVTAIDNVLPNSNRVAARSSQTANAQPATDLHGHGHTSGANHSTWQEALLAMELTDTIEISLRRGRMIDVHHQPLTEQLAFKGMMSAVGCGILAVLPMLLLVLGWIAGKLGLPIAAYWPHGLLLILGIFLVLQALPWLLYGRRKPSGRAL